MNDNADTAKIQRIIRREMRDCIGLANGRLSSERDTLKHAYHGGGYAVDPDREADGWSTYVDRTVMETVEWAKGPLLKVFAGSGDLVRFEPSSPDEEEYAQNATDYVNKIVFGRNAFDLVYGPLTDGLYQRVGWAKAHVEEEETVSTVRELEGLSEEEARVVAMLAEAEGLQTRLERDAESGAFRVRLSRLTRTQRIAVTPVPSERVIYSGDALSVESARFIAHWEDRMAGELLEDGYSWDELKELPSDAEDAYPETRTQRAVNSDDPERDSRGNGEEHDGGRLIRVYEAYLKADTEGDGRLRRLKVTYAGGGDNIRIMRLEEWTMDRPPLFAACSLPLPYSPVGLSLADLVIDLQKLRTEMMRDVLDNMYLSNHGEVVINRRTPQDRVNLDQFFSRSAGGAYETVGDVTITPLPVGNIASAALSGLELTDKVKEQRTGIGMHKQGLSADVLQNTATGAAIMEEAQNVRLEMIARVYAETFFKPMARYILALAHRYLREPVNIQRRGGFAAMYPSEWNPDMSVTVVVGLGTGSRQRQAAALQQLMSIQDRMIKGLGKNSPVRLTHVIRLTHKMAEALGIEAPEQYFGTVEDARQAEEAIMREQAPDSPDTGKLEMQKALAEQKLQLEREKAQAGLQNDAARFQADLAIKQAELEQKGLLANRQMELEAQLDGLKMTTSLPKAGTTQVAQVE